ncbi:hypothetical protein HDU97_009295 [Phlyctochytrium planicorne]|nr:hypothetical protein HDU97_009295 [Phlyctochytrium planicorne]
MLTGTPNSTGDIPWVANIQNVLGRSSCQRPKVMIGSDMGLIDAFGNIKVSSFAGSHPKNEPAKSETDSITRRKNLKITAMHPFSKCYLATSLQSGASATNATSMGRPSMIMPPPSIIAPTLSQFDGNSSSLMPQPRKSVIG